MIALFYQCLVCNEVESGASFSGRKLTTVVYPPILFEMDYVSYVVGSCCYSQALLGVGCLLLIHASTHLKFLQALLGVGCLLLLYATTHLKFYCGYEGKKQQGL